jgi:hypothetical protein
MGMELFSPGRRIERPEIRELFPGEQMGSNLYS